MYLASTGLLSPIGLDAEATCAAMRAGIAAFAELPYRDNSGDAVVGASVPGLDPKLNREDRLVELLAPVLDEKQVESYRTHLETQGPGLLGGILQAAANVRNPMVAPSSRQ